MSPDVGPHDELRESVFVEVMRILWVQFLTPCRELSLTLELRRLPDIGTPVLLCVAGVQGAPLDALALSQVSMDEFAAAVERYREELEQGAPGADERMRSALADLAQPIILDRAEARRVVLATKRLFPGVLEEALEEAP
jgi:hypothetical protein